MGDWSYRVGDWPNLARMAKYSSATLAQLCGVSKRQVQRHFRDVHGLKLTEWLNELRLRDARGLLGNGKQVKAVSFALGFKRSNHFSRQFKAAYGITPERFSRANDANPHFETEYLSLTIRRDVAHRESMSRSDTSFRL